MSDADSEVSVDEACDTLARLYDDPDQRVTELVDHRTDDETVVSMYDVFWALANEDRLRLLEALRDGEFCGCELMVILDAPQSTVATHLRKLREAGLVKSRKKGKWNYYRIADTAVMDLLDLAAAIEE